MEISSGDKNAKISKEEEEFSWIQPCVHNIYTCSYFCRIGLGNMIYLVFSFTLCIFFTSLNWSPVLGEFYKLPTRRVDYDGTVTELEFLSTNQMIYFMAQTFLGFTFVNLVTLANTRGNCLYSLKEEYSMWNPYNHKFAKYKQNLKPENAKENVRYSDITKVMLLSPLMFMLSGQFVLKN